MNKVHVLDCTLRDGGYCNQWKFGFSNIKKIISGLTSANIDIIECGFLSNSIDYAVDVSKFKKIEQISSVIPNKRNNTMYVAMANYGDFDVTTLPVCNHSSIDGIRVAFHKKDYKEALALCKEISSKGYKVFVQAMVSLCYTDEEFLTLIKCVNELQPYAFYIVDSFGMMKTKDLTRLFYMVEHNLDESIWIGFHSHNNMQLAFSNAQILVSIQTNRNLIVDSSVYGMGRGAGNLNTEIFVEYLNNNFDYNYYLKPLLYIIDDILNDLYQRYYWGYSLPNYLSAVHSVHPNYAIYLDDKKTLAVDDINEIFSMMDESKKFIYDKNYVENLYINYMSKSHKQEKNANVLQENLIGKKVLLIAPGKSLYKEKNKIRDFLFNHDDIITISVNSEYTFGNTDYIFISNIRRFRELNSEKYNKCIITSNINSKECYAQINYIELINEMDYVRDNAGLMLINFLIKNQVEDIILAGFDGYNYNSDSNYVNETMTLVQKKSMINNINNGMIKMIGKYMKMAKITFLTKSYYADILKKEN